MKKQIIQVLWGIAQGQPQVQGEAVVYPNIREQLNAIKALMSIEGWEEEELPTRQSTPAEHPTMPAGRPVTPTKHSATPAGRPATPVENPATLTECLAPTQCPTAFTPPHPIQQKQRPRRKKQLFIRGTSIPISR
ncbi:hypothetical protein [uncultured Capnocytophaga sp.]|uniref:hypothetical protein n=1 Tax=uncultured Capnocytophaga sp. TaxID=159273 RepID=UPI0026282E7B|nr:hypothetical protein [uncultured Capnocytophaga sp.]